MATQPRPPKRHKSLILKDISPQSIVFPSDGTNPRPYDPSKPLVVTADRQPKLLLGRSMLEEHLRVRPERTVRVVQLAGVSVPDLVAFRRLDDSTPPLPSDLMHAVAAARRTKLPLAQIAEIIPGVTSLSDASVFSSLANSPPYVVEMFDRGELTLAHIRRFVALPSPEQQHWAARVVTEKLRVSGLVAAMAQERSKAEKTADIESQETILSGVLGTPVDITWDTRKGKGGITIPWSNIEELQGVMTAIGHSPPCETKLPIRKRSIHVEIDSLDEFHAFVGHLFAGNSG